MNTNQIRKFATEARIELLNGVKNKLKAFFNEKGTPHIEPQPVQGGCLYGEQVLDETFYRAWQSLYQHIKLYGLKVTAEDVAYTWFNRLVAINILSKNSLAEPLLQFTNPTIRVPHIVEQARAGQLPEMNVETRRKLNELLDDDTKTYEQFSLLIDIYCASNPIINKCFGAVDDFSYLLLPNNILAQGGLVDRLNSSEYITDDDYRSPELIGWLYQFYISEKKDEVFAKKGKFESDEIPAATQIFTPNWIVKYMVQNSLGRIYLDTEPYSELKTEMKYLVQNEEGGEKFSWTDAKELTCADLACGSGHILNECFDLLYDIYIEQGYSRRDAIESIFKYNLLGLDIDTRAKQMATFALLLKACRRDASFADAHAMPRVYDMPAPYPHKGLLKETLTHFFLGGNPKMISETTEAIELFDEAKNLGSIMKFKISPSTREAIVRRLAEYRQNGNSDVDSLFRYLDVILALTDKYASLVMNPPYMGSGNMNPVLSKYVKSNYEEGKADLFSTFMILAINRLAPKGKYGMINMHSWMFLSSFEKLRESILTNQQIDSLLHLGPRTFDELSGEVVQNAAFVITKSNPTTTSTYYRLVDGKNCADKERMFFEAENSEKIYYPHIPQNNFEKIPGCPIGYWVSENILSIYNGQLLKESGNIKEGLKTGDNDRFIRLWSEVSFSKINKKWFPHTKGGQIRRWYGNNECLLNYENNGEELNSFQGSSLTGQENYFKQYITYGRIGSGKFSSRFTPEGFIPNMAGLSIIPKNESDVNHILAITNSKLFQHLLGLQNPTLNNPPGVIASMPILQKYEGQDFLVQQNINISKLDWDAHETSWDFQRNELLSITEQDYLDNGPCIVTEEGEYCTNLNDPEFDSLEWLMDEYKEKWQRLFYQLHYNEEELNRQFIEIYGLQDELTPDVPMDEVTILQQGEITIENGQIKWNDDVIVKQLISYAIGCWMGRYRLDKHGLNIAHPNPTADEVCTYEYNGEEFQIDEDGIIPILSEDSSFADNACHRLRDFLRIAFGEDSLIENINFIQNALGKSIEAYFMKDFWKDHKKMYQNRPIYWLFSSKKNAFQCLVYMHRMNAYTAEIVRTKYLLPHIDSLKMRIAELRANDAMLSTAQRRNMERLIKELDECNEYHERLHAVADQQIAFDLDDGVVVNYAKFGDVLAKIK